MAAKARPKIVSIKAEDDDTRSTTSAISWYMLKETDPKILSRPVVSLNQAEYECIVGLLSNSYYSCQSPSYWILAKPPYEWSEVIKGKGHQFVWPFVYNWFGMLKIGLLQEGLETADRLYENIVSAFRSLDKTEHTYVLGFLLFTHLGDGQFRVCCKRNLRSLYTKSSNKIKIGRSISGHSIKAANINNNVVNFMLQLERKWNSLTSSFTAPTSTVPALSVTSKPLQYKTSVNKRCFLSQLNIALEEEEEENVESLEGATSVGFQLELERAFAYVGHQLTKENEAESFLIWSSLYDDDGTIKASFLESLGEQLDEFIDKECEDLLNEMMEQ